MEQPNEINRVIPTLSDRDHSRGSPTARIVLMKYGDYQCPHSRQAHYTIQAIQHQLGEQFCYVFRHFPQSHLHPQAQRAAETAEAAAAQGKFWEMHNCLFEHQHRLDDADLVEYAAEIGLDISRFLRSLAEHTYADRVQVDRDSGLCNGVEATPTFFVSARYEGTQNLEALLMTLLARQA